MNPYASLRVCADVIEYSLLHASALISGEVTVTQTWLLNWDNASRFATYRKPQRMAPL